uniref:Uncharacterized protein n=1 Tax=Clytia hemisphaerica TaxID=252671 RepID=A0A7M5VD53_9CNID
MDHHSHELYYQTKTEIRKMKSDLEEQMRCKNESVLRLSERLKNTERLVTRLEEENMYKETRLVEQLSSMELQLKETTDALKMVQKEQREMKTKLTQQSDVKSSQISNLEERLLKIEQHLSEQN